MPELGTESSGQAPPKLGDKGLFYVNGQYVTYTWDGSKWVPPAGTQTGTQPTTDLTGLLKALSTGTTTPIFLTTSTGQALTKAEYQSIFAGFKNESQYYGVNSSDAIIHAAVKMGVSGTEWTQRMQAIQFARQNKDVLTAFYQTAQQQGLVKGQGPSLSFVQQLLTGSLPGEFENLWQTAYARTAFERAGLNVGGGNDNPDLNITPGMAQSIAAASPGDQTFDQFTAVAQQYAQLALNTLPSARYENYGLTKEDLMDIAEGQGDVNKIAIVQRLAHEQQLGTQAPAEPGVSSTAAGFTEPGLQRLAGTPTL